MSHRPIPAKYKNHPWLSYSDGVGYLGITCDSHDRCERIKQSTDITWLRRVLACKDNQLTVRKACAARIRRLTKP